LAVEGEERLTAGPGLAEGEEVRPAVVDGGAAEVVLAAGGTWRVPQLEQKVPGLGVAPSTQAQTIRFRINSFCTPFFLAKMFRDTPKNKDIGTEWDAIQRRLGNLPAEPEEEKEPEPDLSYSLMNKQEKVRAKVSEAATLEELDELEDQLLGDDDERFLQEYRQKRIAELEARARKAVYGQLQQISQTEYKDAVQTKGAWVVVFLFKPSIPTCQLMHQRLSVLAGKFPATKFVKILSEDAIKGYPDKNLPTLLLYQDGELKKQFIGLSAFHGESMTTDDLEWALKKAGAVDSDMEEDPRNDLDERPKVRIGYMAPRSTRDSDDEDDDSD
jgi:thiol-disulfide isomerase/thioredoxin